MCHVSDSVCELLLKSLAICLDVVVLFLVYVIELFSVVGGALLDRPCKIFQRVCVVPVIPVYVWMLLPYVLFAYVGSNLHI